MKKSWNRGWWPLVGLGLWCASCDSLTRDIEVELPPVVRELVVECYLEAGRPYRVLLTETKGYFDPLDECPMVRGALVVIEHQGVRDTLEEAPYLGECTLSNPNFLPFFNEERTRFYNYGSASICPLDYNSDFKIYVQDPQGNRTATATTRMIPPVSFDSITATFNDRGKAYAFLTAQDDGNTADFYQVTLHKGRLYKPDSASGGFINTAKNPEFAVEIEDASFFNGKTIAFGTGYDYEDGDTLIGTLYHIEQAYYQYIQSTEDAQNVGPFSQPPVIRSNIQGGKGIFTFLSYDRDTLVVRR